MAYWQRRASGKIAIYYTDPETKKTKTIPRKTIHHLDELLDEEIDKWVERWSRLNEVYRKRPEFRPPTPEVEELIEDYIAYLDTLKKRPNTLEKHKCHLTKAASYFADKSLAAWPDSSWNLAKWLREMGESEQSIRRIYQALRKFWKWCMSMGLCEVELRMSELPSPRRKKTPLKILLTPQKVLEWVQQCPEKQAQFMALAGYFFSLRPQETFALKASDFVAGSKATVLECCQSMRKAGLFDRLAVYVSKQKARDGEVEVKTKENEYVACFNEEAAKLMVKLLKEGTHITYPPDYAWKYWKKVGMEKVTLKDLRRASIYWLGHSTTITESALMNHARHSDFNTTLDYLRRPDKEAPTELSLDLDL